MKGFDKRLNEFHAGEWIYINAINLTANQVSVLRKHIKSGHLALDPEELDNVIVKDRQGDFISGDKIAPQMYYIVK